MLEVIPVIAMKPLAVLCLIVLAGCQTSRDQGDSSAKPHGLAAALAGEWAAVGQPDDYLLFKPDDGDPKSGRFGGYSHFSRYEIKGGLSLGSHAQVELIAGAFEADEGRTVIEVGVSGNGQTLTAKMPASAGKGSTVRTYRKVSR